NRAVLRILFLIMGGMAAAGLAFALWTQHERRKRDATGPTPVVVTPPLELSSLRYLPGDVDTILGIHVAEILEDPTGRVLLTQLPLPVGNAGFDIIEQWTGLSLEEMDHLVLGLRVEEHILPRVTLVVQTRRPMDTKKVVAALKAKSASKQGKKYVYPF